MSRRKTHRHGRPNLLTTSAKPVIQRVVQPVERPFVVLGHKIAGNAPQFRTRNGKRISWLCEFEMTCPQRAILEAYRQKCRNVKCDDDANYTVKEIHAHITVRGTTWYLLEFEDFEEPFWYYWKRESELADCQELVQKYEESQGKTKFRQVSPLKNKRLSLLPSSSSPSSKRHIQPPSTQRPSNYYSPMTLRSSMRRLPIQKPPSTRSSPRYSSTRRSSTRRWSTKLATINRSSEPSPMSLYDLPGEASSSHVDLISPIGPSSSQFFCHMVDDEIRQIGEQYGAPKRLLPISPWSSQCLANYLLNEHSPQSFTKNEHSMFDFSQLEATPIQCLSEVPSPINISSNERLLDLVKQIDSKQIDSIESSERSSGTANNGSCQFDDRDRAPNRCSPIKTMPSQPSPVGLLPCKPFSSPQSVFEFSPMKVQRLSDASPPLKTTPSQYPSISLVPNESSFSCSDEKVLTAISCEDLSRESPPICLSVLKPLLSQDSSRTAYGPHSPTKLDSCQHLLPYLGPTSVTTYTSKQISRSLHSPSWMAGRSPSEQSSSRNLSPWTILSSQRMPEYLTMLKPPPSKSCSGVLSPTLPCADQRINEPLQPSPTERLPTHNSSLEFLSIQHGSSDLSDEKVRRVQEWTKAMIEYNKNEHKPKKRSSWKLSSRRLSIRRNSPLYTLSTQRSPNRHSSTNRLPSPQLLPYSEKNKALVINNRFGAPLKRKRMPDGSWKTLPWLEKKGYVESPYSCNSSQRPSMLFSPDGHLPMKPSPEKCSSNRISSRQRLLIRRSIRRAYRQQLSSALSDENRQVREQKRAQVEKDRYKNTSVPLRRLKMADGTWKTQKWIKPKGEVQSSHSS